MKTPDLQVGGPAGVESAVFQLGVLDLQDAHYRLVRQRHELADKYLRRKWRRQRWLVAHVVFLACEGFGGRFDDSLPSRT